MVESSCQGNADGLLLVQKHRAQPPLTSSPSGSRTLELPARSMKLQRNENTQSSQTCLSLRRSRRRRALAVPPSAPRAAITTRLPAWVRTKNSLLTTQGNACLCKTPVWWWFGRCCNMTVYLHAHVHLQTNCGSRVPVDMASWPCPCVQGPKSLPQRHRRRRATQESSTRNPLEVSTTSDSSAKLRGTCWFKRCSGHKLPWHPETHKTCQARRGEQVDAGTQSPAIIEP